MVPATAAVQVVAVVMSAHLWAGLPAAAVQAGADLAGDGGDDLVVILRQRPEAVAGVGTAGHQDRPEDLLAGVLACPERGDCGSGRVQG